MTSVKYCLFSRKRKQTKMAESSVAELCKDAELETLKTWLDSLPNNGFDVINQFTVEGKYPISIAATLGRVSVVEELLERGAAVSCLSVTGYSPLHYASIWGHLSCVKVLLNAGCKTTIQSCHGETARDIALRYSQNDCVKVIDKAELLAKLQETALRYKSLFNEPSDVQMTKDDKNFFIRCCDEKLDWIEMNREISSIYQIRKHHQELEDNIKPLMAKANLTL